MILLSYLSGAHILFKIIQVMFICFLAIKNLKIEKAAFVFSILFLFSTIYSAIITQYFDMRLWAQAIVFILFCIIGKNYNIFKTTKYFWYISLLIVILSFIFWFFDFNFSVGKNRLFLDEQSSIFGRKMINGFGSEVNYTAFFFVFLCVLRAFQTEKLFYLFPIIFIGLIQDSNLVFIIFIFVLPILIFKKAILAPLFLAFIFYAIFIVLQLERAEGLIFFGPRHVLWNSAIEIIQSFPEYGHGYSNTQKFLEAGMENFDKQYYVHNGFLEAGMAAGPIYLYIGALIILYKLFSFVFYNNWKHAGMLGIAVIFITFNAGFLGSLSLGGILISYLIGVPSNRKIKCLKT